MTRKIECVMFLITIARILLATRDDSRIVVITRKLLRTVLQSLSHTHG